MASPSGQQDLSSLIMRATNPVNQDDDPNLVQAVCQEVGNDMNKIQVAIRLIVHKMQSPHEREALQALLVLQACINNCGPNFHSEVGKFRFLNEMIKLVSPKYYGNQTPDEVKKRVVELLYTWTVDLKVEPKISEAYDMLKKQGVVKEDPQYLGAAPAHSSSKVMHPVSFEDEKKSRLLQRLLQSKKPEDISKANALIKHMVKEDERRTERSSRRIVEVETAFNNVKVLDEMLTQYNQSSLPRQADLELMEELHNSCQNLRSNIYRIVSEMEDKEDGIGDLLKASDELSRVMGRYKLETEGKSDDSKPQLNANIFDEKKPEEDTLLDLSPDIEPPPPPPPPKADSLSVEDLGTISLTPPNPISSMSDSVVKKESILDELEDVFSDKCLLGEPSTNGLDSQLLSSSLIQPAIAPLISSQPVFDTLANKPSKNEESQKHFNDLDLLGSNLLRESLPSNIGPIGAQFKVQEKVSLNQMKQKAKLSESSVTVTGSTLQSPCLIEENFLQKNSKDTSLNSVVSTSDSEIELISDLVASATDIRKENVEKLSPKSSVQTQNRSNHPQDISSLSLMNARNESEICSVEKPKPGGNVQLCEVKPLHNINVAFEDIKAGKQSSVLLMESNGLSVVLHFTDNKPREDVSIIVVSVTSRNSRPISNYVLQAVGPKGCKVRLQSPSSTNLAEYSPFLPPPAITQIMLIANPNQLNVSLKVMLSYTVDDDAVTDMAEIEKLPL